MLQDVFDNLHQILFSDDPNGIQLNIPNGVDNDISHAKKVLTPEMVNLGIKVQCKYIFLQRVLYFCPYTQGDELCSEGSPSHPCGGT